MAERKLDKAEKAVVYNACENFLTNYIGANQIDYYHSLKPLADGWQERLTNLMYEITAEYFEWDEKNLDT